MDLHLLIVMGVPALIGLITDNLAQHYQKRFGERPKWLMDIAVLLHAFVFTVLCAKVVPNAFPAVDVQAMLAGVIALWVAAERRLDRAEA